MTAEVSDVKVSEKNVATLKTDHAMNGHRDTRSQVVMMTAVLLILSVSLPLSSHVSIAFSMF